MQMEIYCQGSEVHAARRPQGWSERRQAMQSSRDRGHSSAKA